MSRSPSVALVIGSLFSLTGFAFETWTTIVLLSPQSSGEIDRGRWTRNPLEPGGSVAITVSSRNKPANPAPLRYSPLALMSSRVYLDTGGRQVVPASYGRTAVNFSAPCPQCFGSPYSCRLTKVSSSKGNRFGPLWFRHCQASYTPGVWERAMRPKATLLVTVLTLVSVHSFATRLLEQKVPRPRVFLDTELW